MKDSFKKQLEDALAHYNKVVFLYQPSKDLCTELASMLKKEKKKILLLTDMETPDFSCSWKRLCEEECRWLLELYFSYHFSDNFIFLTDQEKFPWPSMVNIMEMGLASRKEILEAMLE